MSNSAGFSLLEVMVVLVIIGMMAAVVAPRIMEQADEAKVKSTKVQIKNIGQALKLYKLHNHKYPASIKALTQADKSGKSYMDTEPKDAWDNTFVYLTPGVHGSFDILSYGADGKAGGADFDADIGNWE
ncbi:MAG: type II secretion system major pseudopilin GspG [Mariprofundales bacterium]